MHNVRKSASSPRLKTPVTTQPTPPPLPAEAAASGQPSSSTLRPPQPLRSMSSFSFLRLPTRKDSSKSIDPETTADPGIASTSQKKTLGSRISMKNIRKLFSLDKASGKPTAPPTLPSLGRTLLERNPDHVDSTEKRTVYSFGGPPPQNIDLLMTGERAEADGDIFRRLSDEETGTSGSMMINVGAMRLNAENGKLASHSFTGCTPIVAFYDDNKTGMYHANSASRDDENVERLIAEKPTDIFIVTRQGTGKSYSARQAANAAYIVSRPLDCRVHILELPEVSELSVLIEPGSISVIQGRPLRPF
jgi:hypothetical protein